MKSLFFRIFVSYWIAQALFVVLALITASAIRPSHEIAVLQAQEAKFLDEGIDAFQKSGEASLWRYSRNIHDSQHIRLYIFDDQGKDLLRRQPPEWVVQAQRGELRTADSFWGRLRPNMEFLRNSMTGPDGRRYTLIIELAPEPHPWWGPQGFPGLGVILAILVSGFVCYVLAKYLTSPIIRLRAATQKLAAGDLAARSGMPQSQRRHDELGELVSDFDQMAERLQNLVDAQRRLLTDISHELRSPLARLNVALELARQRSGPDARSALDRIDRETNRLNELISALLTIARLDGGSDAIRKEPVALEELVREIAKDAAFECQHRHCQVSVIVTDECEIMGNPRLLHSALENVVRNAIRYTQEGTSVEIRLEKAEGHNSTGPEAVVRVTDSGPGVPENTLGKLFQPFYRIDDARGRQTGGVGLGLAITEKAVLMHGGSVRAANRPQGGLMVEVRLPLLPQASEADLALPADVPTGSLR